MRVPIRVHEGSEGPTSREARFTCHICARTVFVHIPPDATALTRSALMTVAVSEHRQQCTVPDHDLPHGQGRPYTIEYPRA